MQVLQLSVRLHNLKMNIWPSINMHYGICANGLLDKYKQSDSSIECHQWLLHRCYETQCLNQIPVIKDIIETNFITRGSQ